MAEIKILSNINLLQNELIYPRVHNAGTAPTLLTAVEGQMYMNTADHNLYVYDGTSWIDLTSQGAGSTNLGYTASPTNGVVTSSTGDSATLTLADGTNAGLLSPTLYTKLNSGVVTSITSTTLTVAGTAAIPTINLSSGIVTAGTTGSATLIPVITVDTYGRVTSITTAANPQGTVTSIDVNGGTGVTVTEAGPVTSSGTFTVNLDYLGTDNFIDSATNLEGTAIATSDTIIYHDATDNNVKKGFVSDLPFTNNAGTITSIIAGNGMNFSTVNSGAATIILGTPSTLTNATTNSLTATSHTHNIDISGFSSTSLADTSNIVYTNAARTINVTHTIATGSKLTLVDAPVSGTDAANKAYVDGLVSGLDVKDSVRAATTANITLSGTQTIDGVVLIAGNRVLVKNQSTASQNGIYNVAAGAWTRSTDADASAEVTAGMFTFVEEGTVNADTGWVLTTNNTITVGTTPLSFSQFSGAGAITAGNGLTQSGTTIDAVGTTNRITVAADSIDIASTYVGQTSITTLGTIGSGTWQGSSISTTYTAAKVVSVGGTTNRITTSATTGALTVDIAATYVGQTSITTLGTIATGTWNATEITGAKVQIASETVRGVVEEATDAEVTAGTATGATGAKLFVTPAKLQTLLGAEGTEGAVVRRKTFNCAAATTTGCAHGFNNLYVIVQIYEVSTGLLVMTEVDVIDADNINVNFNVAPTASQYKIIVIG